MSEELKDSQPGSKGFDFRALIQEAIREFVSLETAKTEPAYKAELEEERRRREQMERRLNELSEENRRSRQAAEEAERSSSIRSELQKLGVSKLDLAYKAVKDDIQRAVDGRLIARTDQGELGIKEFLSRFVTENPELLPARIAGGSGVTVGQRATAVVSSFDLEKIRPGMPKEELERARQEIARVASELMPGI